MPAEKAGCLRMGIGVGGMGRGVVSLCFRLSLLWTSDFGCASNISTMMSEPTLLTRPALVKRSPGSSWLTNAFCKRLEAWFVHIAGATGRLPEDQVGRYLLLPPTLPLRIPPPRHPAAAAGSVGGGGSDSGAVGQGVWKVNLLECPAWPLRIPATTSRALACCFCPNRRQSLQRVPRVACQSWSRAYISLLQARQPCQDTQVA